MASRIITQHAKSWVRPRAILGASSQHRGHRVRVVTARDAGDRGHAVRGRSETDPVPQEDLAGGSGNSSLLLAILLGVFGLAWVWELDLALIRFLANQPLCALSETPVTLGDLATVDRASCWEAWPGGT